MLTGKMDPKISLVIPVRNEAHSLETLLRSISDQTKIPDEIVFVDAGSTDETAHIIKRQNSLNPVIKLVSIGQAYPGTARNAGVIESSGELVAFTDGGIELDRDWLKELCATMAGDASSDVVYGNYRPRTETFFKECLSIAIVPPPSNKDGFEIRPPFLASSLLKKSIWKAVGGFPDFRAAEDRIFMESIVKHGYREARNPKAMVTWDIPGGFKEVFNRFCNYSYHDLLAGRTRDWHLPVLKMHIAAILFFCLGFIISPFFFLLPIVGLAIRTACKVIKNRKEPYFKPSRILLYFFLSGFLVFFIDMSMFAGWVRYLLVRLRK
jgi:glycosyltransferase involved in cell wall biosynthesis